MWELDCEEGWAPKNWCFWSVVLEKTLESPLDCKEIQPVHPKGNQSWVFTGMEKAIATHSSTLAWKIPWMEEPGRLQSTELRRVGHDWATSLSFFTGSPLQCSCLENPRDGGAWWAAVYGVAQNRTRPKWLNSSSSNHTYPRSHCVVEGAFKWICLVLKPNLLTAIQPCLSVQSLPAWIK